MELNIGNNLPRLARICHDTEITLGMHDFRISKCLAKAVKGNLERCNKLEGDLSDSILPIGLIEVSIAMTRTLLENSKDDTEKAGLHNNLSVCISNAGDSKSALEEIQIAVEIYRSLARANQELYEPLLALSLNNLSNRLCDTGDNDSALEANHKAMELYCHLVAANKTRYDPDLVMLFGTQGTILFRIKKYSEALESFQRGRDIITPYAEKLPQSPHAALLARLIVDWERTKKEMEDSGASPE